MRKTRKNRKEKFQIKLLMKQIKEYMMLVDAKSAILIIAMDIRLKLI